MTVSIDTTSKKYHGRMASTYEPNRTKQQRWHLENDAVRRFLSPLRPRRLLDVPCGTGRFFSLYDALRVRKVIAVDVSDEMLAQATERAHACKRANIAFACDDVRTMRIKPVDVSVCVRFLDLIDESAMRGVMVKLMKTSTQAIICTIRFGPKYVPKSNTAEHDEKKFAKLLRKNGWRIAKRIPIFSKGWNVLLIKPRK